MSDPKVVAFGPGNGIKAYQDHGTIVYHGIPANVEFTVARMAGYRILRAQGYGQLDHYGSGALYVPDEEWEASNDKGWSDE